MNFSDTLKRLRHESGHTQEAVAEYLSRYYKKTSRKMVDHWENGRGLPDALAFLHLCNLYGVLGSIPQQFWTGETKSIIQSALESGGLTPESRAKAEDYIRLLRQDQQAQPRPKPARTIPLYQMPVSAGDGIELDLDSGNYEQVSAGDAPAGATFAVTVSGVSMEPKINDGQRLYVKAQQSLEDGEIGIIVVDGSQYVKQKRGDVFASINPNSPDITGDGRTEGYIIGKVLI